jgi:sortase A
MPLLLKVGLAMMLSAILLAAVVGVVVWLLPGGSNTTSAPTKPTAAQSAAPKKGNEPNKGQKLKIEDEPTTDNEPTANNEPTASSQPTTVPDPLPALSRQWPEPSQKEVAATNVPRYYQPTHDSTLSLTVGKIGLYDVPVINSNSPEALDRGVIHLPQTPMPWDTGEQKNVYLAGHRIGYEGTGSRLVFYNLNQLKKGDPIVLKDGSGNAYEYRVSEVFVAKPDADWVVQPVRGRDMVTLQTCTLPVFENRLIVRADRV